MIVAIDGPSGAGKTTVSREVARCLGMLLLDTGAIYRGAALLARDAGISWDDGPEVARLLAAASFAFRRVGEVEHLIIDGVDVAERIRTPEMSEGASRVSAQPAVRAALLDLQRRLGRQGDRVVEGRDIGTVVFPDADHKFFLTASLDERVHRRQREYEEKGKPVSQEEMRREVAERDARDAGRDVAPLVPAEDAVLIDSTRMSFAEVVQAIVDRVQGIGRPGGGEVGM